MCDGDCTRYIFYSRESYGDQCYAQYDQVGDSIEVYLPEFVKSAKDQQVTNPETYIISLICGIFGHEDVHRAISNADIDTTPEQEHHIIDRLFYE